MTDAHVDVAELEKRARKRQDIEATITQLFAAEDEGLQYALSAAKEAGLPKIQISPVQGKFLQLLAAACHAQKILEIGSLAGYSGIWLARALPPQGRLITLEIDPERAELVRKVFARAGVGERSEVRVGKALEVLPQLVDEAPFDLIFIDADKPPYPDYLDWALRLSRPGSIIVGDNCIRAGKALRDVESPDANISGPARYNQRVSTDPRLVSLALPMDDDYMDGFTISVVK